MPSKLPTYGYLPNVIYNALSFNSFSDDTCCRLINPKIKCGLKLKRNCWSYLISNKSLNILCLILCEHDAVTHDFVHLSYQMFFFYINEVQLQFVTSQVSCLGTRSDNQIVKTKKVLLFSLIL